MPPCRDAPVRGTAKENRVCPDGTGVVAGTRSRLTINPLSHKGGTLRQGCTASLVSMFRTMAFAGWQERRRRLLVRLLSYKIGSPAPVREPPLPIGRALIAQPSRAALCGWIFHFRRRPLVFWPPALHKGLSGECRFRYSFMHAYNFTDGEVQCPLRLSL